MAEDVFENEEIEVALEKIETDPWNNEFARLQTNLATKHITFPRNKIWNTSGDNEEDYDIIRSEDDEPYIGDRIFKYNLDEAIESKRGGSHYKFIGGNEGEITYILKRSLPVNDTETVSVVFEPNFQSIDDDGNIHARLVEISIGRKEAPFDEVKKIVENYSKVLPKKVTKDLLWDVSERVMLQQTKLHYVFGLGMFQPKGFILNSTSILITPSHLSELKNPSGEIEIPDEPIVVNLGKPNAKKVFYRVIDAVEKAKPNKTRS